MVVAMVTWSSRATGWRTASPTARMAACGGIDDGGELPDAVHAEAAYYRHGGILPYVLRQLAAR